jgi:hypothetical protein
MSTVWNSNIRKSNTNNLPAPNDLTENPYGGKKRFFKDATQKSVPLVVSGIAIELQPTEPIFEKSPHLREKGGVLTEIWHIRNRLSRTVRPDQPLCIYCPFAHK